MKTTVSVPALRAPVQTEIAMPGSKSHANRAIVCACLAKGRTVIRNATPCDDVSAMVKNLKLMGFGIEWRDKEKGELVIDGLESEKLTPLRQGFGGQEVKSEKSVVLDCGNAGTTLRFLTSICALVPGTWTLTGDEHMRKRPIGDLVAALRSLGAKIEETNGCPPLVIQGGLLRTPEGVLPSVRLKADKSSQYLSSLLLIAPLLPSGLSIEIEGALASQGYVSLTEKTMRDFGVRMEKNENKFFVHPPQAGTPAAGPKNDGMRAAVPGRGRMYDIEGDWSAAGAWIVLKELTGSRIAFSNLRSDSGQSDRQLPLFIDRMKKSGDLTLDCSEIPDQVMNLCVLAAFRKGTTTLTGIANLRLKECDRLHVITTELRKVGISIEENDDGLIFQGKFQIPNSKFQEVVTLDPNDDHRMAMAFAILGLVRGSITIKNPACVAKSYPAFFADLEKVSASTKPVTIVGMRGVGKSALGRKLASKLKLKHVDSDHLFEKAHGAIRAFIEKKGWPEFRTKEEEIIAAALTSGVVLSVGGGALISAKTRKLLKDHSIVVWLQATEKELIKRLKIGKRPSLTDLPLEQEVRKLLLERGPQYREAAHIELSPKLKFGEQVPFVIQGLQELLYPSR